RLFRKEQKDAESLARRAIQLAQDGIPADGAIHLLRRDPLTQGLRLFSQHCGTCHTHGQDCRNDTPTASDLKDFGTKEWILGTLKEPDSPHYFGRTNLKAMTSWVKGRWENARKRGEEKKLEADFDRIAEWLAGHPLRELPADDGDQSTWAAGARAFMERCLNCHAYKGTGGAGTTKGPDFTGYGDANWLRLMIMSPACALR